MYYTKIQTTKNSAKIGHFSTASESQMFQSPPFTVQKQPEQDSKQPEDIKTALMRAQRYGHNLSYIKHFGVTDRGGDRQTSSQTANNVIQQKRESHSSEIQSAAQDKQQDPRESRSQLVSYPILETGRPLQIHSVPTLAIQMGRSKKKPPSKKKPSLKKPSLKKTAIKKGKREQYPAGIDAFKMPSKKGYAQHVVQRMTHTVTVLKKAVELREQVVQANVGKKLRRAQSMFSLTAEAQAGTGARKTSAAPGRQAIDAAHLMNTTFRPDVVLENTQPTIKQTEVAEDLRLQSAATTNQLQSDNVGSDKVIDGVTTKFIQAITKDIDAGKQIPKTKDLIDKLMSDVLQALKSNAKKKVEYKPAIDALNKAYTEEIDNLVANIDTDEMKPWRKENL